MQVVDIVSSIYSPTGYRRIISLNATASPQARVHNLTRHRNHNPLLPRHSKGAITSDLACADSGFLSSLQAATNTAKA
ncbi:hypothetical protein [Nostoc sp. MS1]|uniref:hypothetical protein n=1 Tax=Nostoc sp. MS1 TaxID=2764711 RepID=UPI001CC80C7C|nr:hypothetical protein [Nostoc sp. MS1]